MKRSCTTHVIRRVTRCNDNLDVAQKSRLHVPARLTIPESAFHVFQIIDSFIDAWCTRAFLFRCTAACFCETAVELWKYENW
eukprot:8415833-Pyramimonas_sp.AAC.1